MSRSESNLSTLVESVDEFLRFSLTYKKKSHSNTFISTTVGLFTSLKMLSGITTVFHWTLIAF